MKHVPTSAMTSDSSLMLKETVRPADMLRRLRKDYGCAFGKVRLPLTIGVVAINTTLRRGKIPVFATLREDGSEEIFSPTKCIDRKMAANGRCGMSLPTLNIVRHEGVRTQA